MCICVRRRFTLCLFLVLDYTVMAPHVKAKWRGGKLAHVCMLIEPKADNKMPSSIASPPDVFSQGLSLNLKFITSARLWPMNSWIPTLFHGAEVTGTHHHTRLSRGCWGLEFTFSFSQALDPLIQLLSPRKTSFESLTQSFTTQKQTSWHFVTLLVLLLHPPHIP